MPENKKWNNFSGSTKKTKHPSSRHVNLANAIEYILDLHLSNMSIEDIECFGRDGEDITQTAQSYINRFIDITDNYISTTVLTERFSFKTWLRVINELLDRKNFNAAYIVFLGLASIDLKIAMKGCNLILKPNPNDGIYDTSDKNNLSLYKDKDGNIFYYIKEKNQKKKQDLKELNELLKEAPFNSQKYDNQEISTTILNITSKRGHTSLKELKIDDQEKTALEQLEQFFSMDSNCKTLRKTIKSCGRDSTKIIPPTLLLGKDYNGINTGLTGLNKTLEQYPKLEKVKSIKDLKTQIKRRKTKTALKMQQKMQDDFVNNFNSIKYRPTLKLPNKHSIRYYEEITKSKYINFNTYEKNKNQSFGLFKNSLPKKNIKNHGKELKTRPGLSA